MHSQAAPQHTNRLIHATSPYLLQHAHNPVDWYEWGEEAFARARAEDKPVLLSVGYAACHWCHVMAHESFEDEATAGVMNDNFINIKVDREERPDVDAIYMEACQIITGGGGWPDRQAAQNRRFYGPARPLQAARREGARRPMDRASPASNSTAAQAPQTGHRPQRDAQAA